MTPPARRASTGAYSTVTRELIRPQSPESIQTANCTRSHEPQESGVCPHPVPISDRYATRGWTFVRLRPTPRRPLGVVGMNTVMPLDPTLAFAENRK